jgi:hypothetical protein
MSRQLPEVREIDLHCSTTREARMFQWNWIFFGVFCTVYTWLARKKEEITSLTLGRLYLG